MMADITLTETMLGVVASMSIKHHVDYAEPNCSFAMKVNWKHLTELLGSPPRAC